MRMVFVIDSLAVGGAQKHLCQLVVGLMARGYAVDVFCLNAIVDKRYRLAIEGAGAGLHVVGKWLVLSGIAIIQLAWHLVRYRDALLMNVLFVSTVAGRLAAALVGRTAITCLQARNLDYRPWQNALLRVTAPLNAFTISNSHSAIAHAAVHEGVDPARSAFVPNGIEIPDFPQPKPDWAELGWPQLVGKRVIGSIGRLHWQKGYDLLIEAMAPICRNEPDICVLLIGRGAEEANLRQLAAKCGIADRVVFAGERADCDRLLPGFTLYVQPSRFEGMPNALMEAMAAGVPVVATDVDGMGELLGSATGWRFAMEGVVTLSDIIYSALLNRAEARVRASVARVHIIGDYHIGGMVSRYVVSLLRFSYMEDGHRPYI